MLVFHAEWFKTFEWLALEVPRIVVCYNTTQFFEEPFVKKRENLLFKGDVWWIFDIYHHRTAIISILIRSKVKTVVMGMTCFSLYLAATFFILFNEVVKVFCVLTKFDITKQQLPRFVIFHHILHCDVNSKAIIFVQFGDFEIW